MMALCPKNRWSRAGACGLYYSLCMIALIVAVRVDCIYALEKASLGTITIVADEWYPMNGDPNAPLPGYMIEIASEIMKRNRGQVLYRIMPWDKALDLVRAGYFDCVVGAYVEDAPDFLFPRHEWGRDQLAFYGLKDKTWNFQSFDDLKNQRIGVITGYAYGEEVEAWLQANPKHVQWLQQNDALKLHILKLLNNRVDLILESVAVMSNRLSELGYQDKIVNLSLYGQPNSTYIACSPHETKIKRSQRIVEVMDIGLGMLKSEHKLIPILDKYGIGPWWPSSED